MYLYLYVAEWQETVGQSGIRPECQTRAHKSLRLAVKAAGCYPFLGIGIFFFSARQTFWNRSRSMHSSPVWLSIVCASDCLPQRIANKNM